MKINKKIFSILVLVIGIVMLAIGIFNREFEIVFTKAANICLECIGIG